MYYNIALLPKEITNPVGYFLWKVMRYVTFALLFLNLGLLVFNINKLYFG